MQCASVGGVAASVRAWVAVHKPWPPSLRPVAVATDAPCAAQPCARHRTTLVTFHMCRNRYCHNVRRQHKSNNVSWTADLVVGVCVQYCQDAECRGFHSEPTALPPDVVASVRGLACGAG